MRALFIVLAIVILVAIGLIAIGVIDVRQTREARIPQGAQAPAFDVDVNPVEVGTERRQVELPVPVVRQRQDEPEPVAAENAQ